MNLKNLQLYFKKIKPYTPLRWGFILFILGGIYVYNIQFIPNDKSKEAISNNTTHLFIALLLKVFFYSTIIILMLSFLTTFFAYLFYKIQSKNKQHFNLQIDSVGSNNKHDEVIIKIVINKAFSPLFGYLKGTFSYDHLHYSPTFDIMPKYYFKNLLKLKIEADSKLNFSTIKAYKLNGCFIHFEDMFRLVSFTIHEPLNQLFYQFPDDTEQNKLNLKLLHAQEMNVRIDELRRVDGEPLNYKDFESGDDVRRINWKVFAKSGNLVVRIPERFEPFASHVNFYASFYQKLPSLINETEFDSFFLNIYKQTVWDFLNAFSDQKDAINFHSDQIAVDTKISPDFYIIKKIITSSEWHADQALSHYFNPKKSSILCIHSFTDPNDLKKIISELNAQSIIYFIQFSLKFKHNTISNYIHFLFFKNPIDEFSKIRKKWFISPFKYKIKAQEEAIIEVLKNSHSNWTVVS